MKKIDEFDCKMFKTLYSKRDQIKRQGEKKKKTRDSLEERFAKYKTEYIYQEFLQISKKKNKQPSRLVNKEHAYAVNKPQSGNGQ